jgi:hypothetical protein
VQRRQDLGIADLEQILMPCLDAVGTRSVAVVIDCKHDLDTVSAALRSHAERLQEGRQALLLLHDIGWPAAPGSEGRGEVLAAVEEFVAERDHLRVAVVPALFGLAVVWPVDASWADRVASVVAPFDRDPVLERLEKNRLRHLAARRDMTLELEKERGRAERMDELLRRLSGSRTFALAGLLSRIRGRGTSTLTDEELRRALG